MVIFYKTWKKCKLNSVNKKQNGLKYSKNDKSSTLPRRSVLNSSIISEQEFPEPNVVVSSGNTADDGGLDTFCKSFIYNENCNGPQIEP